MTGFKPITLNTPTDALPHTYAEDDAAIFQSIVGEDGVFSVGQELKATVLSNNKVRVADGVLCVGGHFGRIPYGEYLDAEITNGQSGKKRNDIILAKFSTTGSGGVDTFTLEVRQGVAGTTAVDPTITKQNLHDAGKIREFPLYRVKIEGLSIVAVEKMFSVMPTIPQLNSNLTQILTGFEFSVSKETPTGETWINGKPIYRRTYTTTASIGSGSVLTIPISIPASDFWIDTQNSYMRTSTGVCYNLPLVAYGGDSTENVYVWLNSAGIRIGSSKGGWAENWEKIVTIRYTK